MSGESIYSLYAKGEAAEKQPDKTASPYTGKYEKHMGEPTKPVYSTFFEKGKEYDGSNVRFFKQREAVIGKNVGDSVDPQNYLKKGGGVRYIVPPVHEDKVYCKPPLDENFRQSRKGNGAADSAKSRDLSEPDEDGAPRTQSCNALPVEGDRTRQAQGCDSRPSGSDGEGWERDGGAQHNGEGAGYNENGNPPYGSQRAGGVSADGGYEATRAATKDFVASNIVEISNMVPKRRKDQAPLATSRKCFGQTPAYLSRIKSEVAQERTFVQSLEDAKVQRQQQAFSKYVYLLPRQEHERLVSDLATRRDECMLELQKMPFSKDTPSMRKRKSELEHTLADIETALKKLNKDALFIYKDDPVNGQWAKEAALKEAQKYAAESL